MNMYCELVKLFLVLGAFLSNATLLMLIVIVQNFILLPQDSINYLFFLSGFFLSVLIIASEYKMLPKYYQGRDINLAVLAKVTIEALFEEVLWRDLVIFYFEISLFEPSDILVILFYAGLFVSMHKVKDKKSYIEMTLYTLLLYVAALLFPGAHYGLHVGRNIYIELVEEVEGENINGE